MTQSSPPPVTPVTVVLVPEEGASADTNASSNSLPDTVEKGGVATVVLDVP